MLPFLVVIPAIVVPPSKRTPASKVTGRPNETVKPVCKKTIADIKDKALEAIVTACAATLL
jgi:hypothetical protein